jgi:hypothetical protein
LRKRILPSKEAWIFVNPTHERLEEAVDVSGCANVTDLLGQPVIREGDTVRLAVDGLDIRVLVLDGLRERTRLT